MKSRSWLTKRSAPGKVASCSSSQATLSTSRWLVGSSSSSTSGRATRIRARAARIRHPPDSSERGRRRSVSVKPSPARTRWASASTAYPPVLLEGRLGVAQLAGAAGRAPPRWWRPPRGGAPRSGGRGRRSSRPPERLVEGAARPAPRCGPGAGTRSQGGRAGHRAGVGPLLAGQDLQQGRLAGAVAADERDPPPRAQRDGHVGEQDALAVRLGEPGAGEHPVRLKPPPRRQPGRRRCRPPARRSGRGARCGWGRCRAPAVAPHPPVADHDEVGPDGLGDREDGVGRVGGDRVGGHGLADADQVSATRRGGGRRRPGRRPPIR